MLGRVSVERERKESWRRVLLPVSVRSPKAHSSQDWARPELGPGTPSWSAMWLMRTWVLGYASAGSWCSHPGTVTWTCGCLTLAPGKYF